MDEQAQALKDKEAKAILDAIVKHEISRLKLDFTKDYHFWWDGEELRADEIDLQSGSS